MEKEFNDVGLCVPHRHYMVDISGKINAIMQMVEKGKYFTINRPRQFGKTTTLSVLTKRLNQRDDYVALEISFELLDPDTSQQQERFVYEFLMMLLMQLDFLNLSDVAQFIEQSLPQTTTMPALSRLITKLVRDKWPNKRVILLIDEVDRSSNYQLFLTFLGMLRNKYLQQNTGRDATFHAVILAGVHDIKTLKAKIRPALPSQGEREQVGQYNSPWNIAADFNVDMSFSAAEIETMLQAYQQETGIDLDSTAVAARLHYYTSGYPYLVSKLCKFVDEAIITQRADQAWSLADVEAAFKMIVDERYTTTLFDSLAKNLENHRDLYDLITQIVINGKTLSFTVTNPVVNLGHLYGILVPSADGSCQIHNRVFEQRIYAHLMAELIQKQYREVNSLGGPEFYTADGLNVRLILQRFQAFMREHYADRDSKFLEREGRLIFLSYLRPIINGKGFDFKEPHVGDERRMDIVITYREKRYVLALKIWRGQQYHEAGLAQLSDYLDSYGLKEGFLLIYDFSKNKRYKEEIIPFQDKQLFAVWV